MPKGRPGIETDRNGDPRPLPKCPALPWIPTPLQLRTSPEPPYRRRHHQDPAHAIYEPRDSPPRSHPIPRITLNASSAPATTSDPSPPPHYSHPPPPLTTCRPRPPHRTPHLARPSSSSPDPTRPPPIYTYIAVLSPLRHRPRVKEQSPSSNHDPPTIPSAR